MRVKCQECAEEHDLEDMEPRFGLPDVIFALDDAAREKRVRQGNDYSVLRAEDGGGERFFLRALVPFAVAQRDEPWHWCMWVELVAPDFSEIRGLWTSEEQLRRGPWSATLANDATAYSSTLGLRGQLRFVDVSQLPRFTPSTEQQHPFVADFEAGLSEARFIELQLAHAHREPTSSTNSDAADDDDSTQMIDCAEHGSSPASVVCQHLVQAQERSVGFVENSSDPGDLQAWCDECEQVFDEEGEMTDAFHEFNDMRLVCTVCYGIIKQRHSPLD